MCPGASARVSLPQSYFWSLEALTNQLELVLLCFWQSLGMVKPGHPVSSWVCSWKSCSKREVVGICLPFGDCLRFGAPSYYPGQHSGSFPLQGTSVLCSASPCCHVCILAQSCLPSSSCARVLFFGILPIGSVGFTSFAF